MFHDDVPEMMTILAMITGAGLEMQLEAEVKSARLLIDRLATQRRVSLDELKNVVHKGDITEIKMLHSPPSLVKELMTAVLMLLGCPEKEAQVSLSHSLCLKFFCRNCGTQCRPRSYASGNII